MADRSLSKKVSTISGSIFNHDIRTVANALNINAGILRELIYLQEKQAEEIDQLKNEIEKLKKETYREITKEAAERV